MYSSFGIVPPTPDHLLQRSKSVPQPPKVTTKTEIKEELKISDGNGERKKRLKTWKPTPELNDKGAKKKDWVKENTERLGWLKGPDHIYESIVPEGVDPMDDREHKMSRKELDISYNNLNEWIDTLIDTWEEEKKEAESRELENY